MESLIDELEELSYILYVLLYSSEVESFILDFILSKVPRWVEKLISIYPDQKHSVQYVLLLVLTSRETKRAPQIQLKIYYSPAKIMIKWYFSSKIEPEDIA